MRSTLLSACLVLSLVSGDLVIGGGVAAQSPSTSQPSLARLAAEEAIRRKTIAQPARVIREVDLGPTTLARPADVSSQLPAAATAAGRIAALPARLRSGVVPQIPIQAVSAGEVVLEVAVSAQGGVTGVTPLRHTPPFTDAMVAAVRTWQFAPAMDAAVPEPGAPVDPNTRRPMASTVLVVGVFRPAALFAPTLGEPPTNVGQPTGAAPFPVGPLEMPVYPVSALNDGVVLLELEVAGSGAVGGIAVFKSAPPFDTSALAAASSLAFRPARVLDRPAPAFVYVAAAFRQPITF